MANVFSGDLAVAKYAPAAAMQFATLLAVRGSGSPPGVFRDGDFTPAKRVGLPIPEFPFANEGDGVTAIWRNRYWQQATSFTPQALGSADPTRADLLLIDEENFHDEGGGILSWDRLYAPRPQTRDVFEDYGYSAQYIYEDASGSTLTLAEQVFSVASRVRWEYFHIRDLSDWPVLYATKLIQLTATQYNKRGSGNLSLSGNILVSSDAQIVAEDSKIRFWKYPYMYRATRWVPGPTAAFWGSAVDVG